MGSFGNIDPVKAIVLAVERPCVVALQEPAVRRLALVHVGRLSLIQPCFEHLIVLLMYVVQVYTIGELLESDGKDRRMKGTTRGMAVLSGFASSVVNRKATDSKDTLGAGSIGELDMSRTFCERNRILTDLRSCCSMVVATVAYAPQLRISTSFSIEKRRLTCSPLVKYSAGIISISICPTNVPTISNRLASIGVKPKGG